MLRVLLMLLFAFAGFSGSSQTTDEDDLSYVDENGVLRNKPLNGTIILPYTHNYLSVLNAGYRASNVQKADCSDHGEEVYKEQDKIDQVVVTDSTIEVHLRIYDNCCYDYLWDPKLTDEGVLDLIYTGYGMFCGCNCCFGHVITFKKEFEPDDAVKVKEIRINGEGNYRLK